MPRTRNEIRSRGTSQTSEGDPATAQHSPAARVHRSPRRRPRRWRAEQLALATILLAACPGRDFEVSPEEIETDEGFVRWEERSPSPVEIDPACGLAAWDIRFCAEGDWDRRIVIVSIEASAATPVQLMLTVTPEALDSTYVGSEFEREISTDPAIMQVFGRIGLPGDEDCAEYSAFVEVEGGASVMVAAHVGGFVEIGDVASLDVEERIACP